MSEVIAPPTWLLWSARDTVDLTGPRRDTAMNRSAMTKAQHAYYLYVAAVGDRRGDRVGAPGTRTRADAAILAPADVRRPAPPAREAPPNGPVTRD